MFVPLPFGVLGGMWAPSVPFDLLFTVNPSSGPSPAFEKWSSHGTPKVFPEYRRHETERAREVGVAGGGGSRKGGSDLDSERL